MEAPRTRPTLSLLESVRCLECGEIYAKPVGGGTVRQNPGCPSCGYVGWLAVSLPPLYGPRRYAVGRPPRRHARRG